MTEALLLYLPLLETENVQVTICLEAVEPDLVKYEVKGLLAPVQFLPPCLFSLVGGLKGHLLDAMPFLETLCESFPRTQVEFSWAPLLQMPQLLI